MSLRNRLIGADHPYAHARIARLRVECELAVLRRQLDPMETRARAPGGRPSSSARTADAPKPRPHPPGDRKARRMAVRGF
jgi:hypothetical protein